MAVLLLRMLLLGAAVTSAACVSTKSPTDTGDGLTLSSSTGKPIRLTYVDDVAPVLASDCRRCHNASSPAGGYSVSDYAAVMRGVRPGDPSSPLVVATQPPGHMFEHFSGDRLVKSSLVYMWVVEYDAIEVDRRAR
jgi:hypothetical protein